MAKIYAPFTDEVVAHLKLHQAGMLPLLPDETDPVMIAIGGYPTKPYRCETENRRECPNEGVLIPRNEGWICPCGKYTQDFCFDFKMK